MNEDDLVDNADEADPGEEEAEGDQEGRSAREGVAFPQAFIKISYTGVKKGFDQN